ncbi:unnamed protein product [Callosobruchus maculatus]|uniref:Uncharacterized protein n=1 Tax=Callosobruchus maculatus TaxID=64391 RepID=A0A653DB29_CALMS|nr:unnamed protein product [Callosobruchus maculatus]
MKLNANYPTFVCCVLGYMRGSLNAQTSISIAQAVMQAGRSSLDPVLQLGGYQAGESDSYIAAMQR